MIGADLAEMAGPGMGVRVQRQPSDGHPAVGLVAEDVFEGDRLHIIGPRDGVDDLPDKCDHNCLTLVSNMNFLADYER